MHTPEGLSSGLELGPRLRVPQEVREGTLGPAEDPLGEDGLGNGVALELGRDPLGQVLGVDLFSFPRATVVIGPLTGAVV